MGLFGNFFKNAMRGRHGSSRSYGDGHGNKHSNKHAGGGYAPTYSVNTSASQPEVTCSNCNMLSASGATFCVSCGTKLLSGCSRCGTSLTATAKFCPDCGTPAGN
ncbi:zinc ribbon domain-containing protein [Stutzerimonas balearica]|uniref:zinc ribbon domain-containing protein n=1 Tax=Stutzerimonas balearica TaxID=74829 RepID=UPI000C65F5A7|nr:hypothetical protein [Pseudomonas sp.]